MATILAVKENITPQLMSIHGVVGTGVSIIRNTIIIYVEKVTDEILSLIPEVIEGYKVEILETGKFEALKW